MISDNKTTQTKQQKPTPTADSKATNPSTIATLISKELQLPMRGVENTLALLSEGCTVPFIARYRKERTGALDEVSIINIKDLNDKLTDISKRRATILSTIESQGKLTPELEAKIVSCWDAATLEDLYLPYKPKKRTRAQIAREHGLEPLAQAIMLGACRDPYSYARQFCNKDVTTADDAIKGAQDIMAEDIANNEESRKTVRAEFRRTAMITSKVVKGKKDEEESAKYADYFEFSEPLKRCPSHRVMAMLRAEKEGVVKINIATDDNAAERISRYYSKGYTDCSKLTREASEDAYKRLIRPSIENEFVKEGRERAEDEAINVFSTNLRQLLLSAPLGQKAVMGIDPGFRTGCKVACINAEGAYLHYEAIFPFKEADRAAEQLKRIADRFRPQAIAIGNGTASRETEAFVRGISFGRDIDIFVVSEDGASVYSASDVARKEFPDLDITVRGAISIARRLMDPLAELVKIDPKSIGVGQYQHDVDQTKLRTRLEQTVESCVNTVGVNLNTASAMLLSYVSGIGPALAANIIDYRNEHGAFKSRAELKKVKRLGANAFTQCAGFLRIPGAANPLDNTAVHPERYPIVKQMAADLHCSVAQLIADKDKQKTIDIKRYATAEVGAPTLLDIMQELNKPGRDPREKLEAFRFDERVSTVDDLAEGMVLPGIVTNITNFGAFVNIGVHQDGLVHVSQLSKRFVASPLDAVKLHQQVMVKVTGVDRKRNRISLSMIVD